MQRGTDSTVFFYVRKHRLILPGEQVLLAFSGGEDSLYLLFFLKELQKHIPFSLEAMHIHHGIRGEEAERDLLFAKEKAEEWKIPFSLSRVDVPKYAKGQGIGLEEGGRILRYKALLERRDSWEKETGRTTKLALAQHKDDQAETVLHHLLRGAGMNGLSAMRAMEGEKIRPLLCIRKEEIRKRLRELSLEGMQDSSNADIQLTRNYIRRKALPLLEEVNGKAVEHLSLEADYFDELAQYFHKKVKTFLDDGMEVQEGVVSLSIRALKKEEALLRREIYLAAVQTLQGDTKDIVREHLYSIDRIVFSGRGKRVELPGACVVRNCGQSLRFEKTIEKEALR